MEEPNQVRNKKIEVDLGLIETQYIRKTSLNGCSCQFPSNYGLPCRHQWKLFFRLANSNTPDVEILSQFRIDKLWKVSQETLVHNLCDNARQEKCCAYIMHSRVSVGK